MLPAGSRRDQTIEGNELAFNRNRAVQSVLSSPDLQWLCLVDADQAPAFDTVLRLLDTGAPLVSAVVLARREPWRVCAWFDDGEAFRRVRRHEIPRDGVLEVAAVGTGCLLIRRGVLEAVASERWFQVGQINPELLQEDIYFSLRAAEVGYPPALACGVRVPHQFEGYVVLADDGRPCIEWPDGARSSLSGFDDAEEVRARGEDEREGRAQAAPVPGQATRSEAREDEVSVPALQGAA
jgi:hypothetical protein